MSDQLETRVLFIGGPVDGRWLLVPDHMAYWRVSVIVNMRTLPATTEDCTDQISMIEYRREYLTYGSRQRYSVFIAPNIAGNVIELLIHGYRPS